MSCSVLDLPNNSWMYIEKGEKKGRSIKIPYGADETWTLKEAESKMNYFARQGKTMLGVFQCVRLEGSGMLCVDFDDKDITLDAIYSQFPFLQNTLMVQGNTKGFHFYVKCDYKGKALQKSKLNFDGDICFKMFEKANKKWNEMEVKEITMDHFQMLLKEKEPETDTESVSSFSSSSDLKPITSEEREMLDLIPVSAYTDYLEWVMFISACKNSWADGIQVADHYSKRADGYEGIDDVEEKAKLNQTKGYLVNLVKKHNLQAWKELCQLKLFKNYKRAVTPFELADFLIKTTDSIVKVKDQLYYYESNYWHLDDTTDKNHVRRILISFLRDVLKKLIQKACLELAEDVESADKKGMLRHLQSIMDKDINHPTSASRIIAEFNTYSLNQPIKFDNKPYLFCFKNCAFDLKTNKHHVIQKEDYITMFADYDWTPSTTSQIEFIDSLLTDILPKKDVRLCKISTLRCGMIGLCFENFVMESGSGGNGKDVLSNLYNATLTSTYFYKGSTSTLLDPKLKSGGNPEVANMNKKRFVVFSEPPNSSTLNMGVLKDITGGGSINARTLYSKNCECLLENITSFICNERPNIGGDVGDAELRRFINIPYEQKYSTNETKISNGYKRANLYYKTKEFQEENKVHLFNYLLTHSYIEPYIPTCISEETQNYLLGSDNTSAYFDDKVEFTDDENDMLTIRELTNIYKEQFSMGSRDYRSATAKKVKEILQRNIKWSEKLATDFKSRLPLKDKDGKTEEITNVIIKVRRIIEKDPQPTNT